MDNIQKKKYGDLMSSLDNLELELSDVKKKLKYVEIQLQLASENSKRLNGLLTKWRYEIEHSAHKVNKVNTEVKDIIVESAA